MDYYKMVQEQEIANGDLYKRMQEDTNLLYLKDYEIRDKDNKAVPDIINVTLNKPAIFASQVISSLHGTSQQTVVESSNNKVDTHDIEEFQEAALNAADNRLQRMGQPSLNSFTDTQLCIRGRIARRVLFRLANAADVASGEANEIGEIIPDITSWDTRYVTGERGVDGMDWSGYHMSRSWDKVLGQYGKLLDKYGVRKKDTAIYKTDIVDIWTKEHNELWVEGVKILEEPHDNGFCPVVFEKVPLGYGDILLDENSLKHEGESIFFMIRGLIPEMNRLVSLLQTLNQRQLLAALKYTSKDTQQEPPDYPESKDVVNVGEGDLNPIDYGDARKAAEMILNILEKQLQQGSITDIDVGNLNFPLSAVALVTIGEGRDQIYLPRLQTKAIANQRTAEMFTRQILNMGLSSFDLGTRGHKRTFKTAKLEGEYETTYKYYVKSPKIDIARLQMADAALRMGVDRKTVYTDILQYEDPDGMIQKYYYNLAEQLSPNVLRNRVITKLLEMAEDDKNEDAARDAQIMAAEIQTSIDQMRMNTRVENPEVPQEQNSIMPLLGDGGNIGKVNPTPAMMNARGGVMKIIKRDTDFNKFQKHFREYQDKFGLNGYRIYFKENSLNNSYANILTNQDGAVATITFNNNLSPDEELNSNIHLSAKHEAIHLLLARFSECGESRYVSEKELRQAEEELVRRLEQLIPDIKHK